MSTYGEDNALADVTKKVANVQVNEAALNRVKETKWGPRHDFDYAKYNEEPRDKTAPTSDSIQPQEEVSTWGANAAKYEWDEDYGDVGPEHKELEEMLFGDEHKVVQGEEIAK